MSNLKFIVIAVPVFLFACQSQNNPKALPPTSDKDNSLNQLMDTSKLKADLNNIISSISSGKPDTNKLKSAGSDILSTAASILSDSGIDKMGGNDNDPAVIEAKNTMKKLRDATGITPQALDSMKQAAAKLMENH